MEEEDPAEELQHELLLAGDDDRLYTHTYPGAAAGKTCFFRFIDTRFCTREGRAGRAWWMAVRACQSHTLRRRGNARRRCARGPAWMQLSSVVSSSSFCSRACFRDDADATRMSIHQYSSRIPIFSAALAVEIFECTVPEEVASPAPTARAAAARPPVGAFCQYRASMGEAWVPRPVTAFELAEGG